MRRAYDHRAHVARAMPERVLLQRVRELCGLLGWVPYHTHDSRRSEPGFPDFAAYHPAVPGIVVVAELKREGKHPTPEQRAWLWALAGVPGLRVYVWRPAQWLDGSIERELRTAGGDRT